MRIAGQAKAGFYPAGAKALTEIARHLYCRAPNPEKPNDTLQILDPCAGEGAAIRQLADALGVPNHRVYCVELDAARAEKIKETIPKENVIGPASFYGTMITGQSFGLAYVNPPFDDEMGGGRREEQGFCERATRLLPPHGVMVLVCPLKAFIGNRSFVEFFDSRFEDVAIYKFPDEERHYNEIAVFGRKRRQELPTDALRQHGKLLAMNAHFTGYVTLNSLPVLGQTQPVSMRNGNPSYDREDHLRTFEIPLAWKPNTFKKISFTDAELEAAVRDSSLNKHLVETVERPPDRPPLPLDRGHLGLMLASGKLNGAVEGPHGVHVVRGSSMKVEYHNREASKSEENPETGAVTTKDVYSQKPVTVIRYVDYRGIVWTQSNETPKELLEEEENEFDF